MAQTHIQRGKVMSWTNATGSDVVSGQVVVVGTILGVAAGDIANTATGELLVEEVHALPKAAEEISQGAQLYWDADGNPVGGVTGSGALTATSSGNTAAGKAFAGAVSGDTSVNIKLNA